MAFSWLINGGDPNHLLVLGWILQLGGAGPVHDIFCWFCHHPPHILELLTELCPAHHWGSWSVQVDPAQKLQDLLPPKKMGKKSLGFCDSKLELVFWAYEKPYWVSLKRGRLWNNTLIFEGKVSGGDRLTSHGFQVGAGSVSDWFCKHVDMTPCCKTTYYNTNYKTTLWMNQV